MPSYTVPEDLLLSPPSVQQGVPLKVEESNRIFGCELIAKAGVLLQLPQAVISTAQTIFHRFYYRRSMKEYRVLQVAIASVFLATKVEESPRKPRDIFLVFDRLLQRATQQACRAASLASGTFIPSPALTVLVTSCDRYSQWQKDLYGTELVILKELGFMLYVDHPHRFLLNYIHTLNGSQALAQQAWNFLNDAMRTNVCLRFKPELIAASSIFLAARIAGVTLPQSPPWWDLMDVSLQDMEQVSSVIANLYTNPKAKYTPVDDIDRETTDLIPRVPQPSTPVASSPVIQSSSEPSSQVDSKLSETVDASCIDLTKNEVQSKSPELPPKTSLDSRKRDRSPSPVRSRDAKARSRSRSPRRSISPRSRSDKSRDKDRRDRRDLDRDRAVRDRDRERDRDRDRGNHEKHRFRR